MSQNHLNWMTGVAGHDARRLQADPAYRVLLPGSGGNAHYFVGLDTSIPALSDKRVRQAFNYAVNRQRMVDVALAGYGRAASTVWPPQALGFDAAQDQAYAYDLGKARQLLEAAGSDPVTSVMLRAVSEMPTSVAIAQIYQVDLAAIGVNAVVQPDSVAQFTTLVQKGQTGGAWIATMGSMNLSPFTFFTSNLFARVRNPSGYTSEQYTTLIVQAGTATDDHPRPVLPPLRASAAARHSERGSCLPSALDRRGAMRA